MHIENIRTIQCGPVASVGGRYCYQRGLWLVAGRFNIIKVSTKAVISARFEYCFTVVLNSKVEGNVIAHLHSSNRWL